MRKGLPCTRGLVEEMWEETALLHSEELGDIVLHMQTVPVVDAATGFPDVLRNDEEICVWLSEAMMMSYPPQNAPLLVAVNLPEDDGILQLHEIAGIDGTQLTTTCGEVLELSPAAEFLPYRTRQIVTAADLRVGTRILVWGEMERIMVFFPECA